jgi:hypothetical protein
MALCLLKDWKTCSLVCDVLLKAEGSSHKNMKSKAMHVASHGGPWDCEMLRIPHCLDNWLTDGGKVVSPTRRPHFTHQKHYFSASGTQFCYRLSKLQGPVRPEGLGKLKKLICLIRP